jgi:hypothetical protein
MSHEQPRSHQELDEQYVQDKAVKSIIDTVGQIREIGPDRLTRGRIILPKLPVNPSMGLDERELGIDRNQRLYYEVLHDPRLGERGINPDIETAMAAEVEDRGGSYNISCLRLCHETALVRVAAYNFLGEPTNFQALLIYPPQAAEDMVLDRSDKAA